MIPASAKNKVPQDERVHCSELECAGGRPPPYLGSLLLGYYDDAGRLDYAGRADSGIADAELERLYRRLQPFAVKKTPLGRAAAAHEPFRIAARIV